jgi:hypothetical protein
MVPLGALWLPILLSAVAVFVWSSVVHMVLGYHRSDYRKLPDEDAIGAALRGASVGPGTYHLPHFPGMAEMGTPAALEKFNRGPVGIITLTKPGPPSLGPYLAQWFVYSVVVGVFAAYLAGIALAPGTPFVTVFRFVATVGLLAYGSTTATDPIWKFGSWGTTLKHVFDGLVYGLLTGAVFAWLWPKA